MVVIFKRKVNFEYIFFFFTSSKREFGFTPLLCCLSKY